MTFTESSPLESWSLVDVLLREQQELTPVERFSRATPPEQARFHRDLIPLSSPQPGEQYAFEVDLDLCSGCKACVSACHKLNGLESEEMWRSVGQLHGGTTELPVLQHVTTACHHCLEPACLHGCPVLAYEKDPVTGIVVHLDDQCIGCQYCMLKCPYDVPKYSYSKGIVRKCDMCHQRLAVGEAPACVQSCPNEAIRIRIVERQTVMEECEANQFLPGAPEPGYTLPTTNYKTSRPLPRNLLPADYFSPRPSKSHLPLVIMLVLTQMSVGAFVIDQLLYSYTSRVQSDLANSLRPLHLVAALGLGLLGLGASVLHLGRPLGAYRAVLGLRTSWLSREILAFGLFAGAATVYVLLACLNYLNVPVSETTQRTAGWLACLAGLGGIACSVMIYADTRRPMWNASSTSIKFLLTAGIFGAPAALVISLVASLVIGPLEVSQVMAEYGRLLCRAIIMLTAIKLCFELVVFRGLRHKQYTPQKRTALLMSGELGMVTFKRFFFGLMGGIVLPLAMLSEGLLGGESGYQPLFLVMAATFSLALLVAGELHERWLFFTASVAPKMPGGLA